MISMTTKHYLLDHIFNHKYNYTYALLVQTAGRAAGGIKTKADLCKRKKQAGQRVGGDGVLGKTFRP